MKADDRKRLSNVEAERSVLGAVLIDNTVLNQIAELRPEDFFSHANTIIFEAMLSMFAHGQAIDYITLEDTLRASDKLKLAGGPEYITELTDVTPTSMNALHYATIVRERAARRRLLSELYSNSKRIMTEDPLDEIVADVIQAAEHGRLNNAQPSSLNESLELLERYQSGDRDAFLRTGLQSIDQYAPATDELVVIAGRPSIGKTALAVSLAERLAKRMGVLFISQEMGGATLQLRRVAAATSIPMVNLRRKDGISKTDWPRVVRAFDDLKKSRMVVVSGAMTVSEICSTIQAERMKNNIQVVFIDHLGLTKLPNKRSRNDELGNVTQTLARLCKDNNITIYLLSQLNRDLEKRDNKRPRLSDLRDSGNIEQDVDNAWFLFRENYYDNDADKTFEVIVAKVRNGPIGTAKLHFDETTGKFSDLYFGGV